MQEQEIKTLYLVLQSTYQNIEIALYNKEHLLGIKEINKFQASKDLIPFIDLLFKENNLSLNDLTFIAVNQGPSPFTTLRIVITTVNALNFAGNLPIIPINGLIAFNQIKNDEFKLNAIILNAFNNDIYYLLQDHEQLTLGWQNINVFLNELKKKFGDRQIRLLGNGSDIFKKEILDILPNAIIDAINPQYCGIQQIAQLAYKDWIAKENIHASAMPLYMKDAIKK